MKFKMSIEIDASEAEIRDIQDNIVVITKEIEHIIKQRRKPTFGVKTIGPTVRFKI